MKQGIGELFERSPSSFGPNLPLFERYRKRMNELESDSLLLEAVHESLKANNHHPLRYSVRCGVLFAMNACETAFSQREIHELCVDLVVTPTVAHHISGKIKNTVAIAHSP